MSRWFWSKTGEGNSFHGPFASMDAAILDAKTETDGDFFLGSSHAVEAEVNAEEVIDNWANASAVDLLYEDALEGWCSQVPKEKLAELTDELSAVFRRHLVAWGEVFSWEVISGATKYKRIAKPKIGGPKRK